MKSAIAAFVAAIPADAGNGHPVAAHHRRRGRLCHLRHAAHHRLAERARHPPRHDPDRRADLGRPPWRHDQDRPPRLGQHVGRGAGHAGPCRLPAPRRQSGPEAGPRRRGARRRCTSTTAPTPFPPRTSNSPPSRPRPTPATSSPPRPPRSSTSASTISRGADLVRLVEEIAARDAPGATVRARISGEAFLTPPGAALRPGRVGYPGGNRHRARAVDQRRHLGRPLPDPALPGGRFRPAQRHHAQGRRDAPRSRISMR